MKRIKLELVAINRNGGKIYSIKIEAPTYLDPEKIIIRYLPEVKMSDKWYAEIYIEDNQ